jgi:hypothetical protein
MLERIYQSKTCLQILGMEEEISLSKGNYLTESEWKIISYLLELLESFKQEQLLLEGDEYVTISHVHTSVRILLTTITEFALSKTDL